jgi:hypothetical protein
MLKEDDWGLVKKRHRLLEAQHKMNSQLVLRLRGEFPKSNSISHSSL